MKFFVLAERNGKRFVTENNKNFFINFFYKILI